MNSTLALPMVVVPGLCTWLAFTVLNGFADGTSRVLVAALTGFVTVAIGMLSVGRIQKEGAAWLPVAYVWFAITLAVGFVVQYLLGIETAWPVALALALALRRLYEVSIAGGAAWPDTRVLRGPILGKFEELQARRTNVVPDGEPFYLWGGLPIPKRAAVRHFLLVGAAGSGKTTCIRLLMNQVLPEIQPGSKQRAVIYDAKGDMPATLSGMNLDCDIANMNPYDQRGLAWNIAEDFTRPEDAVQLAAMLYTDSSGTDKQFFTDGARMLIAGFIELFQERAAYRWTLRDIICAGQLDAAHMEALFDCVPRLKAEMKNVFAAREFPSIVVSVAVKLRKFSPIAAAWDQARLAGREMSLETWLKSESILLLPARKEYRETLEPLNALFVRRLGDLLLSQPDDRVARTWFFLDEFASLGFIDSIPELAREGRSKGAALVLGFQELASLKNEKKGYGEATNTILGQIHTRAYLQILDPDTSEWASTCLLEHERIVTLKNWSPDKGQQQANHSEQLSMSRNVLPSELQHFPVCDERNGLHGYYSSTDYGQAWKLAMPASYWLPQLRLRNEPAAEFIPHAKPCHMREWGGSDYIRLGMEHLISPHESNGKPTSPRKSIWDLPKRETS